MDSQIKAASHIKVRIHKSNHVLGSVIVATVQAQFSITNAMKLKTTKDGK